MIRRRGLLRAAGILASALAVTVIAGCGADEDRVALAVTDVRWTTTGDLTFETECAEISELDWAPTSPDGIPRVEIWGAPSIGRCDAEAVVPGEAVPEGTAKVLDTTTSQVIDLPARP